MDFGADHTDFGADYAVIQIMRFDGVLYCVLRPVISTGGGDMYGVVAQKNGEWVFERLYAGD